MQQFPASASDALRAQDLGGQYPPAGCFMKPCCLVIALTVRRELGVPEAGSGRGQTKQRANFVAVPETSVYEDHCIPPWQDNVRVAWDTLHVQPETKARTPKSLADQEFRRGVPSPDAGHERRGLLR